MPLKNGSYFGKTAAPQFRTYQTAGLLRPAPSVQTPQSPTPPPVSTGVAQPQQASPPLVGPPAPSVPAVNDYSMAPLLGQASPARDQLIKAVMGGGKGLIDV